MRVGLSLGPVVRTGAVDHRVNCRFKTRRNGRSVIEQQTVDSKGSNVFWHDRAVRDSTNEPIIPKYNPLYLAKPGNRLCLAKQTVSLM
ncbi:MAG: hypothetical protein EBX62_02360 [Betaproteobacteria bacterium]|nr:hypothetical protein [Betaproteobacteria bacterium]